MKVSIIVSTYNRPDALRLALRSLCRQSNGNTEIVVADDGSTAETGEAVADIQKGFPSVCLRHVWHRDEGFRLSKIRNEAVKVASGDYLVFLDGDCVVPPGFVQTHRALAEKGWFVFGQRILTSEAYAREVLGGGESVLERRYWRFWNFLALRREGKVNRFVPALHVPLGVLRHGKPGDWRRVRGCNWGMWKSDYVKVGGSDESFQGWGSEDKDLAVRLINSGVKMKDGRLASYVLHLWHPESGREMAGKNAAIVEARAAKGVTKALKGLE